ncbi:MAG: hypothetical protein ACKVP7_26200 [Hyphomicrobiaceae bacterium]
MSNDNPNQPKGPTHIAYQVREAGEGQKSYFNRIGAVWAHKDGEGFNLQLDSLPVDGRITVRSVQERLQEAKDNARDGDRPGDRKDDRREASRDEKRSNSSREDRSTRDAGPRYER